MPTVEEISTWSLAETLAEIQELLPPQWKFNHSPPQAQCDLFQAEVIDAGGTVQWTGASADSRLLFLDVYGWLWMRSPKPAHPIWRRRQELTPQIVRAKRLGVPESSYTHTTRSTTTLQDPEDLDPKEVDAVYKNVKR